MTSCLRIIPRLLPAFIAVLVLSAAVVEAADIETGRFHDSNRGRDIPYKAYWPATVTGPVPVVIFSRGLGGTREVATYLGEALADAGYLSIHIQHAGSDRSAGGNARSRQERRENLRRSVRDRSTLLNRLQDVPFVVDELARRNRSGKWAGRMDLSRIGMAGHSYGARSTMYAAGERVGPRARSFKEPRIKAGVVLSPNTPRRRFDPAVSYQDIDIPLFHITGTEDRDANLVGALPVRRTRPYELGPAGDKFLLVFDGADHRTFGGLRTQFGEYSAKDPAHHAAIGRGVVAFFDAYLKGDGAAEDWLRRQFRTILAPGDRFEYR